LPSTLHQTKRHCGIGLFFWLGGLLLSSAAAADGPPDTDGIPLRLTVEAPLGCSDSAAFLSQLRKHTPRVREAARAERARSLIVALRAEDGQFVGALTVRDEAGGEGHREVRGADCPSVVAGLAFVAAVIVDPRAALREIPSDSSFVAQAGDGASPRSTTESPSAEAAPRSPPPRDTASARQPGTALRLAAGAGIEMARGLGPDTAVIPRLFVDLELPRLLRGAHVRLSAGRGLARSVGTEFGTADIALTDVRVDPCVDVTSLASFQLGVCGIVDGVYMAGAGTNTWQPQDAQRFSVELGLGLRPRWVLLQWVTLEAMIGGAAPLVRYRFFFAPDTTAYRLAAVSGFVEFAAGVRFW
jgi:hypothetical protein